MILPWHIIRLWVLISLAALLAGVLLAPAPTLADEESITPGWSCAMRRVA